MGKTQVLFAHTDLPETVLQASVQIGRHCCSSGFIGRPHLPEKDTVVKLHEKLTLTPRLPTSSPTLVSVQLFLSFSNVSLLPAAGGVRFCLAGSVPLGHSKPKGQGRG